jgi:ribosomal protein L29
MKRTEELQSLRGLAERQLYDRITDSHKKLALLRQDKILGKLKNFHEITHVRKLIARMRTVLDEKVAAKLNP